MRTTHDIIGRLPIQLQKVSLLFALRKRKILELGVVPATCPRIEGILFRAQHEGVTAIAANLPNAQHKTLVGQNHMVAPTAIARMIKEFLA